MWTSEVAERLSPRGSGRTDNAFNLAYRTLQIVIHHNNIGLFGPQTLFFLCFS
jgi:hypothetical protein